MSDLVANPEDWFAGVAAHENMQKALDLFQEAFTGTVWYLDN